MPLFVIKKLNIIEIHNISGNKFINLLRMYQIQLNYKQFLKIKKQSIVAFMNKN
jgi:hypothetical protein